MKTFFLTWKKKSWFIFTFSTFSQLEKKGTLKRLSWQKFSPRFFIREHRRENSSDQNEKTDHQEKKTFFFSPQGFCKKVMRWRKDVKDLKSKKHK